MQSRASTIEQYLATLPPDRRAALQRVREVVRANLDGGYEEGMQYGMIGYYVPHSVYPPGYHCDARQPLPFAGLASQKNHMSLYLMGLYIGNDVEDGPQRELSSWFKEAWAKSGKKLDMGKACIRFKKLEDLPLEVIGETVRRLPAGDYVALYEQAFGDRRKPAASAKAAKAASAAKPAASKKKKAPARKPAAKAPDAAKRPGKASSKAPARKAAGRK